MALAEIKTDDGFSVSSTDSTEDELRATIAQMDEAEAAEKGKRSERTTITETTESGEGKAVDKRTREGKRQSIQAEIDEFTSKRAEAQRAYEATQKELEKAKAALTALEAVRGNGHAAAAAAATSAETSSTVPDDDPEPQFEQFLNEADASTAYYRAIAKWEGRKQAKAYFAAQQEISRRQSAFDALVTQTTSKQEAAKQKLTEVAKTNPKIWEQIAPLEQKLQPAAYAVANNETVTSRHAIADCILDSERPDLLLLRFVEQPDELERISALPVHLAHREMGKLEATLIAAASGPASKPIVASAAPPPTKPLGGAPRVAVPEDEARENESFEDFVAREDKAERERKARRRR